MRRRKAAPTEPTQRRRSRQTERQAPYSRHCRRYPESGPLPRQAAPTSPRVWQGTSVSLPAMVFLPKRWSNAADIRRAEAMSERSNISEFHVKGIACQTISPAAMACSMRWRFSAGGLLQVLVEHPGGDRPDIAFFAARFAQRYGSLHGPRKVIVEVSADHAVLSVRKAHVEVAFVHHVNRFDLLLRLFGPKQWVGGFRHIPKVVAAMPLSNSRRCMCHTFSCRVVALLTMSALGRPSVRRRKQRHLSTNHSLQLIWKPPAFS